MKRILVSGATGFLGSNICKSLLSNGFIVIALYRNSSNFLKFNSEDKGKIIWYNIDLIDLNRIFTENKIDFVIHTACSYGKNNETKSEILNANLFFGYQLLKVSIEYNVKLFLNTGTILNKFKNDYSYTKNLFSELMLFFAESIKIINLRLDLIYGTDSPRSNFISWLVENLLLSKDEIEIKNGNQQRFIINIQDVIDAVLFILSNGLEKFDKSELALCNKEKLSIKEIVEIVSMKIVTKYNIDPRSQIQFLNLLNANLKSETDFVKSDLTSFGWSPKISFESGIEEIIESIYKKSIKI
jgi:nucleoside-diphosphate-sugar epimerase